ncbi:MAG: hypothetical protein LAP85_21180 [Acidobacteriia bacterium]|nr:hypothetical protein [Terriglobia bacterium]
MKLGSRIAPWVFILCTACSQTPGGSGGYKIAFTPSRTGQFGIFTMNSDTTGSKLLAPDQMAQLRFASWSRDGKKIAFFTARTQDAEILKRYRLPYQYLLYTMDATGGNQKRLLDFPVLDFAWAPDSRQLFFISAYESPDRDDPEVLAATKAPLNSVYVLDLQTGAQMRLPGSGRNPSACWAPDARRLAVSYGDPDNGGIYVITSDGRHSSRLTDSPTIDVRPKWSPDGKYIAYVAVAKTEADAKDAGVWVIGADGTGRKKVTDEVVFFPTWSLDSRMLLLQSDNGVRLVDPDGKRQDVLLSARLRRVVNAIFTPDSKGVMFCSDDEGAWNIYSIGLDGQNRKKITGKTNSSNFCLSPMLSGR